jgi:ribA/ribD-fused uncharacterized protein
MVRVVKQRMSAKMLNTNHAFTGEYLFLSNMFLVPIVYRGRVYGSSEAAYQAQKCSREEDKNQFMFAKPHDAKKIGRALERRPDFEDLKVQFMREILTVKFRIPELRAMLLATGDMELVEANYWKDFFWGVCKGEGQNLLGKLLMEIREAIRKGKM